MALLGQNERLRTQSNRPTGSSYNSLAFGILQRVLGSLASLAFVQQIRGLDPGRGAVSQSRHQLNVSIHLKLIFSFKITRRILLCKAVVKLPINQREILKLTFVRRQSDMAGNM